MKIRANTRLSLLLEAAAVEPTFLHAWLDVVDRLDELPQMPSDNAKHEDCSKTQVVSTSIDCNETQILPQITPNTAKHTNCSKTPLLSQTTEIAVKHGFRNKSIPNESETTERPENKQKLSDKPTSTPSASRPPTEEPEVLLTRRVPAHLTELYEKSTKDANEQEQEAIEQILVDFAYIFSTSPADIGRTELIVRDIYTGKQHMCINERKDSRWRSMRP